MLSNLMDLLTRLVVAMELIAFCWTKQIGGSAGCCKTETVDRPAPAVTGRASTDPAVTGRASTDPVLAGWDPRHEVVQGAYRTDDKKAAINPGKTGADPVPNLSGTKTADGRTVFNTADKTLQTGQPPRDPWADEEKKELGAGAAVTGSASTDPVLAGWDPRHEAVQGAYRTDDKKAAIDRVMELYGLTCSKSTNYVQRHQLILQAVAEGMKELSGAQETGAQAGNSFVDDTDSNLFDDRSGAATDGDLFGNAGDVLEQTPAMLWDEFADKLMREANRIGFQRAKQIVSEFTAQMTVTPETIPASEFHNILRAAAAEPTPGAGGVIDYVKKREEYLTIARAKSKTNKPAEIQAAVKHLAPAVTQVTDAQLDEAIKALSALK